MKKIIFAFIMAFLPLVMFSQNDGVNKPFRWVGTGVWTTTPPVTYQPTKGVFHVDTVANKFYIHKGGGIYDELTTSSGSNLWTDAGTHIWRNSPVSVSNNDGFSFLYDLLVDDVNGFGVTDALIKNSDNTTLAQLAVSGAGGSPITFSSFGSFSSTGSTLGLPNEGTSRVNGGATLNIVATSNLRFGVPLSSSQPAFSISNGNIFKDATNTTGTTNQFLGNNSGQLGWMKVQSNYGTITTNEAGWNITNNLFIETAIIDNSHSLPVTWDGEEGDVMTFMNKSSVDKDIFGNIDNTSSVTLTVVPGQSVQFMWDSVNSTWWVM